MVGLLVSTGEISRHRLGDTHPQRGAEHQKSQASLTAQSHQGGNVPADPTRQSVWLTYSEAKKAQVTSLIYPELLLQPRWVLQSASVDRPGPAQLSSGPNPEALQSWSLIEPGWRAFQQGDRDGGVKLWNQALQRAPHDLLLQRAVNAQAPQLLRQGRLSRRGAPWGSRIAIVLSGELRCLQHTMPLLQALARSADLFTCTSAGFATLARQLPGALIVVDPEPRLPMGAMQQWHKLAVSLAMVREQEIRNGQRYTHILKLRSDFHHVNPRRLLDELVAADGLICASDKVFGGRRELMLLFEGFYPAITGWFDEQEQRYWPINVAQILRSDDSAKWYGMVFPQELVGLPASVDELRAVLSSGGKALTDALLRWKPPASQHLDQLYMHQLHRLSAGYPRFASEVCFARFLNFNAIPAHHSPGLLGFLRSDRRPV